jgi:Methyltransferase FkbM domain
MTSILPDALRYLQPVVVEDLARRGRAVDGGYVVPASKLAGIDAVLSFGLSTDWSLEEDLFESNARIAVHAYDHTVGAASFRRALKNTAIKFVVGRVSLDELRARYRTYAGYRAFFAGGRVHYRERVYNRHDNANDATIETIFRRLGDATHVLLKMDIEGGEYRVIPPLLTESERIDLMIIEFHDTDPLRPVFEQQVKAILTRFDIVHVHGNNIAGVAADGLPDCLEITFINKRFPNTGRRRDQLPLAGIDRPNDPAKPDLPLRFG